jgi:hypothetical protein
MEPSSHFVQAELGALFLNCKEGMIFCLTLEELGRPQPKIPIYCNNATIIGTATNTVKQQWSWLMRMRYFWVCDKVALDAYNIKWYPGQENLDDYLSKHHPGAHHTAVQVQAWYLHKPNSPLVLPWASKPSTLKKHSYIEVKMWLWFTNRFIPRDDNVVSIVSYNLIPTGECTICSLLLTPYYASIQFCDHPNKSPGMERLDEQLSSVVPMRNMLDFSPHVDLIIGFHADSYPWKIALSK